MRKIICSILLVLGICRIANTQNLLPHGHFECGFLEEFECSKWWPPTISSTDIFFGAKSDKQGLGYQEPHSKRRHIGILSYTERNVSYKEYYQTKLTERLVKDSLYCVKMYVSLADSAYVALPDIEVGFTRKKRRRTRKKYWTFALDRMDDIISCTNTSFPYLSNKESWMPISGVFKAKGKESFLTIGHFSVQTDTLKMYLPEPPKYPNSKNPKYRLHFSYYFIDDVSLHPIKDSSECICSSPDLIKKEIQPIIKSTKSISDTLKSSIVDTVIKAKSDKEHVSTNILKTKKLIFEQINFEVDSDRLLITSKLALDSVISLLNQHAIKLEIQGHTDNTATQAYNFQLSEKRAKVVYKYLIAKGISPKRLRYKGLGASVPIMMNTTEIGRKKNRRVEFHLIEN